MPRPSSRTRHPRRLLAVAGIALLTAASACGDDDDDTAASDAPAATDAAAATDAPVTTPPAATGGATGTSAAGTTPAAGGATIALADSELGSILVDDAGRTLYMFVPDAQGPSVCTEGCLEAWPAIVGPATAGDGVDAALLGTATRTDDGSEQATCDGWPLYLFASDVSPGDVNGQGVGDNWYVLDGTCTPVGMP